MFEMLVLGVSVGIGTRNEVVSWTQDSGSTYASRKFYRISEDGAHKHEISYRDLVGSAEQVVVPAAS